MDDTVLAAFSVPSRPGNERLVRDRVGDSVAPLAIPAGRLERLLTAVAEAAMNAIEHGNHADEDVPVDVAVVAGRRDLRVLISDQGGGPADTGARETPDLEAKLAGLQSHRGWGLFLIEHMVDGVTTSVDAGRHTIELRLDREPTTPGGETDATQHV